MTKIDAIDAIDRKDTLVKVDMTGNGTFQTIAGMWVSQFSFSAESIAASRGGLRKPGPISGSCVFRYKGMDKRVQQLFFDGKTRDFQIFFPVGQMIEGAFQIVTVEYSGSHNGEATYEMSMASAGALTYELSEAEYA